MATIPIHFRHKLVITRFTPEGHPTEGHTYIEIIANLEQWNGKPLQFDSSPYTVVVSRSETNKFSHNVPTIEAAQSFLQQHRYDIAKIAPPGRVRAYYEQERSSEDRPPIQYFYQGRSHSGGPYWRSDEHGAAWLTPAEFDFVAQEAANDQWTKKREIMKHAPE